MTSNATRPYLIRVKRETCTLVNGFLVCEILSKTSRILDLEGVFDLIKCNKIKTDIKCFVQYNFIPMRYFDCLLNRFKKTNNMLINMTNV
jgi:hypothetical protein